MFCSPENKESSSASRPRGPTLVRTMERCSGGAGALRGIISMLLDAALSPPTQQTYNNSAQAEGPGAVVVVVCSLPSLCTILSKFSC